MGLVICCIKEKPAKAKTECVGLILDGLSQWYMKDVFTFHTVSSWTPFLTNSYSFEHLNPGVGEVW